jgi:hypothetical protein
MKHLSYYIALSGILFLGACTSEPSNTAQQQQIEEQIKSDEAKMDSLQKAIEAQMESVSDDSVLNTSTAH